MTEFFFLGIDVGTSSVKMCIFNNTGELIRDAVENIVTLSPQKEYMEIDLIELQAKILELLKSMVSGYENNICSIGFSVTSPTLVLFDKDLNPLRPGILYLDNRSSNEVSEFVEALGGKEQYFNYVGNNPSPSTCLPGLIKWIKKNESDVWEKTYKIGYLNSYLASQLTGNLAVDPTITSYSGLVKVDNPYQWDQKLMDIAEIDKSKLPNIIHSFDQVGTLKAEIAERLGLKKGIPVAIGSADTAASSLALGLKKHGDVFESMGTSEVLTFCLDRPLFNKAFMNRCHVIPGLWLAHGAMSTTGAATNWLKDNVFTDLNDINLIEQEALMSEVGANGVIFLPYLSGERSPIFDPDTCGVFFGLNLKSKRSDIVRAVYEGAGYGIKQLYVIAQKEWNVEPEFIRCVGGAARCKFALQVRSDILNKQYKAMEVSNASAYGAAMLSAVAANYFSIHDIPYCKEYCNSVNPIVENSKIYNQYFNIYKDIYPRLKELMHNNKLIRL